MKEEPNLIYLNHLASDDEVVKNRLILVLKEEFFLEVADYRENMECSNFIKAAAVVHKIRHKIGFLGLEKGSELSNQHEQNLKNNSTIFHQNFEDILKEISKFITKI